MRFALAFLVLLLWCCQGLAQTFEAENLSHTTGQRFGLDRTGGERVNAGWEGIRGVHGQGFLTYGPYQRFPLPPSKKYYWAQWKLRQNGSGNARSPLATFEIYDATAGVILVSKTYRVYDIDSQYTYVNLFFGRPNPNHLLEFRTYWHGTANLRIDRIKIDQSKLHP